jgi:hypothetical protein
MSSVYKPEFRTVFGAKDNLHIPIIDLMDTLKRRPYPCRVISVLSTLKKHDIPCPLKQFNTNTGEMALRCVHRSHVFIALMILRPKAALTRTDPDCWVVWEAVWDQTIIEGYADPGGFGRLAPTGITWK